MSIKLNNATDYLARIDRLEPFNSKAKGTRGFQIRTVLLLQLIMDKEGENQAHYKDVYGWTFSSVSANTKTLLENGFIVQEDDERDPRGQSKRIYLAEGVREYLEKTLGIEKENK